MTSSMESGIGAAHELLKVDSRGRIRMTPEQRAGLLEEFDRSGMTGAGFARHYGINYTTERSPLLEATLRCELGHSCGRVIAFVTEARDDRYMASTTWTVHWSMTWLKLAMSGRLDGMVLGESIVMQRVGFLLAITSPAPCGANGKFLAAGCVPAQAGEGIKRLGHLRGNEEKRRLL